MEVFVMMVLAAIAIGCLSYAAEKRWWNNGVSKKTGERWKFYATDSTGARGYHDNHGNEIWISWVGIDKR